MPSVTPSLCTTGCITSRQREFQQASPQSARPRRGESKHRLYRAEKATKSRVNGPGSSTAVTVLRYVSAGVELCGKWGLRGRKDRRVGRRERRREEPARLRTVKRAGGRAGGRTSRVFK
eukprot:3939016-Rhodomonas_salina.6